MTDLTQHLPSKLIPGGGSSVVTKDIAVVNNRVETVEDALRLKVNSIETSLAAAIRAINLHHPGSLDEYVPPITVGVPTTVNKPDFTSETGTVNESVENGEDVITVVGPNDETHLNIGVYKNFYIEVDVRAVDDYADLLFFRSSTGNGLTFRVDTQNGEATVINGLHSAFGVTDGIVEEGTALHDAGEWYTVRLELMNGKIRAFVDGLFYTEMDYLQVLADANHGGDLSVAKTAQENYTYLGLGHGDFKNITYGGLVYVPEVPVGDEVAIDLGWDPASGYTENALNTTPGVFAYTTAVGADSDYLAIEYTTKHAGILGDKVLRVAFAEEGKFNKTDVTGNKGDGVLRLQSSPKVFWGSTVIDSNPIILQNDGLLHTYAIVVSKTQRVLKYFVDGIESHALELTDAQFNVMFDNFDKYFIAMSMDSVGLGNITARTNTTNFTHPYGLVDGVAPSVGETSDLSSWVTGNESSYDGVSTITVNSGGSAYFDTGLTDNFTITAEVKANADVVDFMFARNSDGSGQYFRLSSDVNQPSGFGDKETISWTSWVPSNVPVAHDNPVKYFSDDYHTLKLVAEGGIVTAYVNGNEYASVPFTGQDGYTFIGVTYQGYVRNVQFSANSNGGDGGIKGYYIAQSNGTVHHIDTAAVTGASTDPITTQGTIDGQLEAYYLRAGAALGDHVVLGADGATPKYSTDRGVTWTEISLDITTGTGAWIFDVDASGLWVGARRDGQIYISTDGINFTRDTVLASESPWSIAIQEDGKVLIGGTNDLHVRDTEGVWTIESTPISYIWEIDTHGSTTILAPYSGSTLYKTTDSGATIAVSTSPDVSGIWSSLDSDGAGLWIGITMATTSNITYSTDDGDTWTTVNLPAGDGTITPTDCKYLGDGRWVMGTTKHGLIYINDATNLDNAASYTILDWTYPNQGLRDKGFMHQLIAEK